MNDYNFEDWFKDDWERDKKEFYGRENCIVTFDGGTIDFSPDGMKDVKGGKNLTYDEYLDIQHDSWNHTKSSLEGVFFDHSLATYKGEISRKTRRNVLFERLYISVEEPDGTCYDAMESHVWMDIKPFKRLKVHDCVFFDADVYRYLKTGHGKQIDYSLCNPKTIEKIPPYQLPSDYQMKAQIIDDLLWENSKYNDVVDRINWPYVRNEEEYRQKFAQLMLVMKLQDISWIWTSDLLRIRQELWRSTNKSIPKGLLKRITDVGWSQYQPGMIFILND